MRTFLLLLLTISLKAQTFTFPPSGSSTVAGSNTQIQYNNGTLGATTNVTTQGTYFTFSPSSIPTPPANSTALYLPTYIGRLGMRIEGDIPKLVQPNLAKMTRQEVRPNGAGVTTIAPFGSVHNPSGSGTAQSCTAGSWHTSAKRIRYSTGSASTIVGYKLIPAVFVYNGGGFLSVARFASTLSPTTTRCSAGMSATGNQFSGADELTNYKDFIGLGYATGETNYSIYHNDGSGTPTKINLGSNFPSGNSPQGWFELTLFNPPNSSTVYYRVYNYVNGALATGSITTDLPSSGSMMSPYIASSSGVGSANCEFSILYAETPY